MDHTNLEPLGAQVFCEYFSLLLGVDLDNGQPYVELFEQLEHYVLFDLFIVDLALLLPNTFQGQFFVLYKNHGWVVHEILGYFESVFF